MDKISLILKQRETNKDEDGDGNFDMEDYIRIKNGNKWTANSLKPPISNSCKPNCKTYYLGKIDLDYNSEFDLFPTVTIGKYNAKKKVYFLTTPYSWIKRGSTTTDYLLLGHWTKITTAPDTDASLLDIGSNIGAYVDGTDPFTSQISSLTGKATYSGPIKLSNYNTNKRLIKAQKKYDTKYDTKALYQKMIDAQIKYNLGLNDPYNKRSADVYGEIELTADFEDSTTLGHIEGRIDSIKGIINTGKVVTDSQGRYHAEGAPGSLTGGLDLERAAIGESHSGFFTGNVTGSLNGNDFIGKWGGQFYGNGSDDGLPETVAGTVAASSEEGIHFVAPWAADKTAVEEEDAGEN